MFFVFLLAMLKHKLLPGACCWVAFHPALLAKRMRAVALISGSFCKKTFWPLMWMAEGEAGVENGVDVLLRS